MRNSTLPKSRQGIFQVENCLPLIICCLLFIGSANLSFAQITSGFELDGNATAVAPNPPDDWDLIASGTSSAQVTSGIVSDAPSNNDNAFVQGSKDQGDISTWHWQDFSVPDKDDILHGGAALYGGNKIYFFGDRYSTNGSAEIGFWFFKNKVELLPNGTFSGTHAVGDILLLSNFVNGGGVSVIEAYEWVGSGGDFGSLQSIPVTGSQLYAITNSGSVSSPWSYTPKSGPVNIFDKGAFFEGGIDLAGLAFSIDPCFTSFMLETRSSHSITAELKDFLLGNFFVTPQVTVNSTEICIGGGPATLTATVIGGEAPLSYSWSTGEVTSSITVSPTVTTTYTVIVNTANGCPSLPAEGTVTVNPLPACSIDDVSPAGLICNHGNYTIGATATGASYLWSISVDGNPPGWAIIGSNTGSSITFSSGNCGAPGFLLHISLTITDANGCVSTCTREYAPGVPACNVSIRPPDTLNCVRTSQYLLASYSTDILNPTFEWSRNGVSMGAGINDNVSLDSILVTQSGTYRFTLVDPTNSANTCYAEVNVEQDITPPGATASGGLLNCAVPSFNIMAFSPTAGVSFSWTGPGGFTSNQQNPLINAPGTYTVVVTNPANGCTSSDNAIVLQNILHPTLNLTGGRLTCALTSIQLTASSPILAAPFNIIGPGGFSSNLATVTINLPGTYTATITDTDNGCTATATAVVTLDTVSPGVSASGGELTCLVTSVQLTSSSPVSGATFSWTGPGGFTSDQQNPTVSAPGTYTVTATNPDNGCTRTATAVVTQDTNSPTVNAGADQTLTCVLTSVTLTATASTGTTLVWSPGGQTTTSITVSSPGTYTVTATSTDNGCTASDAVVVGQNLTPPTVNAGADQTLTCVLTSITLTATASTGTTLVWSPGGQTTTSITVSSPGTYTVTATRTDNGCTASDAVVVGQNLTPPTVNAGADQTLTCILTSITLTANASTGTTLVWSPGGQTTSSITVSSPGTYTVTATRNDNGCTASDAVVVGQNLTPPTVNAGADQTLTCVTTSATLTAAASAGTTLVWSPGGQTTASITVSSPGTYTVTATRTDNGCTASDAVVVGQSVNSPTVNAGADQTLTCVLTSITLTANASTGTTLVWSPGGQTTTSITVSSPGTYTVTATRTDNGCTVSDAVVVGQNLTPPTVNAGADQTLTCVLTSITLTATASAGTTLVWSPGGQTTASITVSSPGTYTVTATSNTNGCTASDAVVVGQNIAPPTVNAGADQTLTCLLTSATLTATASTGTTLIWSPGGQTTTSITVSSPGTYTVTATRTDNGCTASDAVVVGQNLNAPTVNAGADQTLTCVLTSASLTANASSGTTLVWSPGGQTTTSITVSSPGTYTVTVTSNANGCTASDAVVVGQNITPPPCSIEDVSPAGLICNHGNYSISTTLNGALYNFSWSMTVDGNPAGWAIVGSNTGSTLTFSSGNCGNVGFLVRITLTVTDKSNGCVTTCSRTFAPGAPACNASIRPPVMLNCIVTSQYLLASYATDILNPTFEWTRNGISLGAGINNNNGLDSILVSSAGTYTFIVHDLSNSSNDCSATVIVTQDIVAPSCNIVGPSTQPICTSTGNVIKVSGSSNSGNHSFSWTVTSTNNDYVIVGSSTLDSVVFTAGSAGTAVFTVVITDNVNGCTSTCTFTATCTNPFIGCTLGFWKNHPSLWDNAADPISACLATAISTAGYSGNGTTSSSFASTFGLTPAQMSAAGYNVNLTLLQALNLGGGGYYLLARQGVASLLNTCGLNGNFIYNSAQVIAMIHDAVVNGTAGATGSLLGAANETKPDKCPPGGPATPRGNTTKKFGSIIANEDITINAYPNPFSHQTTIEFSLVHVSSQTSVEVFDVTGKRITRLFDANAEAGVDYKVQFNAETYPAGIYFVKITTDADSYFTRLVLVN